MEKQMEELYKKREKEHVPTIATMHKHIEDLEGTLKLYPTWAFLPSGGIRVCRKGSWTLTLLAMF